jgi:hypothetical protein
MEYKFIRPLDAHMFRDLQNTFRYAAVVRMYPLRFHAFTLVSNDVTSTHVLLLRVHAQDVHHVSEVHARFKCPCW